MIYNYHCNTLYYRDWRFFRTTTKTEDLVQSLSSITYEGPVDTVVLTVKDVTVSGDGGKYKISFYEDSRGIFSLNEYEAFDHYSENLGCVTADFICIGRYYKCTVNP